MKEYYKNIYNGSLVAEAYGVKLTLPLIPDDK
jgi:hypothetical protein